MLNSQNYMNGTVQDVLKEEQKPLGTLFNGYNLTSAINQYTLDPFQYSITKFKYRINDLQDPVLEEHISQKDFQNNPGLVYRGADFEKLLPSYTSAKKSVNDFPAQSYHRFMANEGYFNPNEGKDNSDLWYYHASGGPALNVQEPNHIIFPEAQRGGVNSSNLVKYSWTSKFPQKQNLSWENQNYKPVNNDQNGAYFSWNTQLPKDFNSVYQFDSNYCRNIQINGPEEGSLPFKG